jgi:transcriptional regulator with GAF, ATPase, and Fis domain
MRNVLAAALAARLHTGPVLAEEIEAQLDRFCDRATGAAHSGHGLEDVLDRAIENGGFSISTLEKAAYESALKRAGGNLSAAARLLGLTRPQLAYRVNAKDAG